MISKQSCSNSTGLCMAQPSSVSSYVSPSLDAYTQVYSRNRCRKTRTFEQTVLGCDCDTSSVRRECGYRLVGECHQCATTKLTWVSVPQPLRPKSRLESSGHLLLQGSSGLCGLLVDSTHCLSVCVAFCNIRTNKASHFVTYYHRIL